MTPTTFQQANNLFISFTGGVGGHHISNMISLCPEFEPKFQSENYFFYMLAHYVSKTARLNVTESLGITAHFNGSTNGTPPVHLYTSAFLDDALCTTLLANTKKNIILGHHHNWLESYNSGLVDRFKKNVWIVCTLPNKDTLAGKRIENLNFNFPETNPYKIPYVYDHRLPFAFAKEENALLFDTDLFFTDSGSQYLRECMNTHFGVVLPPEADMLHIEWMKWMKHLNDTVFTK
jgi:hypothetical protein